MTTIDRFIYAVPIRKVTIPKTVNLARQTEAVKMDLEGHLVLKANPDGFCGSHAVQLSTGEVYHDESFVDFDDMAVSLFLSRDNVSCITLLDVGGSMLYIYRNPILFNGKTIKLILKGGHYDCVLKYGKMGPVSLVTNFRPTKDTICGSVGQELEFSQTAKEELGFVNHTILTDCRNYSFSVSDDFKNDYRQFSRMEHLNYLNLGAEKLLNHYKALLIDRLANVEPKQICWLSQTVIGLISYSPCISIQKGRLDSLQSDKFTSLSTNPDDVDILTSPSDKGRGKIRVLFNRVYEVSPKISNYFLEPILTRCCPEYGPLHVPIDYDGPPVTLNTGFASPTASVSLDYGNKDSSVRRVPNPSQKPNISLSLKVKEEGEEKRKKLELKSAMKVKKPIKDSNLNSKTSKSGDLGFLLDVIKSSDQTIYSKLSESYPASVTANVTDNDNKFRKQTIESILLSYKSIDEDSYILVKDCLSIFNLEQNKILLNYDGSLTDSLLKIKNDNTFPEIVKLAKSVLLLRGHCFESLVRFYKSNYNQETSLAEFILELNKVDNDLSRQVFKPGVSECKDVDELSKYITDKFSSRTSDEILRSVTRRTPDIINISKSATWKTLIVCDPSSSSNVTYREKEKRRKYNPMFNLVKDSSTVTWSLETPVVNGIASNLDNVLSEVVCFRANNPALNNLVGIFVKVLTKIFNNLRVKSVQVQAEFMVLFDDLDMGCLEKLEVKDYLTDRDKKLCGLTDKDVEDIFDLETKLPYEDVNYQSRLFEKLRSMIKDPEYRNLENGSAISKRTDIHFDKERKIRLVKESMNQICLESNKILPNYKHSPDPMGYFPVPSSFKLAKKSGLMGNVDVLGSNIGERDMISNVFSNVLTTYNSMGLSDRQLFESGLNGLVEKSMMIRRSADKLSRQKKLEVLNDKIFGFRITGKNRIKLKGQNRENLRNEVDSVKVKKFSNRKESDNRNNSSMRPFQAKSVDRINDLIEEMSNESAGKPEDCLRQLMETNDLINLDGTVRKRLTKYFTSVGSQMTINFSKMAYELNLMLTNDQSEGELIMSNLGVDGVYAVSLPGCRLSDSSGVRHVKFFIRKDLLVKGQCFFGEFTTDGNYFVQSGYSKITHKSLSHMINMATCLTPLFNESSYIVDSKTDHDFKSTIHQIYWMAGDSNTNKLLGVVRYLALLVFAVICEPDTLIKDELSITSLPWRKDIHIYTIEMMRKNLPTLISESGDKRSVLADHIDGTLLEKPNQKFKRLLYGGYHNSFRDMLNEFYMYYTWNKSQSSEFEGSKKIFNKLLKSNYHCKPNIDAAISSVESDPNTFTKKEFHLNTGVRKKDCSDISLEDDLVYLLSEVKENQQATGYAPFLYSATTKWLDEHMVAENFDMSNFNPLMKDITVLSNTRGSLVRTELIDKDNPLLTDKLKKIADRFDVKEILVRQLQSGVDKGEITVDESVKKLEEFSLFEEMITESNDEDSVIDFEDETQFEKIRRVMDIKNNRPIAQKKRFSKYMSMLGYDVRGKCIDTVFSELVRVSKDHLSKNESNYLTEKCVNLDEIIYDFVVKSMDMIHGLSPKTQHLSDRELRIMDIMSKGGLRMVEDLARSLTKFDKRETTTTDKWKQTTQMRNSKLMDNVMRTGKAISIKLSADKSKWGPGVLPTECLPMLRAIAHKLPNIKKFVKLCMFMVIKLQSKRVLVPKTLLSHWWTYEMDMERLGEEIPHLKSFLSDFKPESRCSFDNVNDMGQGMLNAFTSLKHLVTTTYSNQLYYSIVPRDEYTLTCCQLSSDDSLEMQSFFIDDNLYNKISTWLTTKTCCWRLGNMISNKKKTAGSLTMSEYNSNFILPPVCTSPTIKSIISAGMVNFSFSWSDTVKGKLSEIKSASEDGVTNSTCKLLNLILKKFYSDLFGIKVIKENIIALAGQNGREIVKDMDRGSIEFGRFPVVDIVKLNTLGSVELMLDSLGLNDQVRVLTNLENSLFFSTKTPEVEEQKGDINTLSLRSMSFRLYKISRLEQARLKIETGCKDLGLTDEVFDEFEENNPISILLRPRTVKHQFHSLRRTIRSTGMQSAYSNLDGLRGIMRIMGMRYSSNYGVKGAVTQELSFMSQLILMNLSTRYDLPTSESLYRVKGKSENDLRLQLKEIYNLSVLAETSNWVLPKQFEMVKKLCQETIDGLKGIEPKFGVKVGNPIESTIMVRSAWNNSYMLVGDPRLALSSVWANSYRDDMMEQSAQTSKYDISTLEDLYGIKGNIQETMVGWGLENKPRNITLVANWINSLTKFCYKPSKIVYGRAMGRSGLKRLNYDLMAYNEDTDFHITGAVPSSESPRSWPYSDDLYDILMSLVIVCHHSPSYKSFRTICIMSMSNLNKRMELLDKPRVKIPETLVSDESVHSDIRFVASVISNNFTEEFVDSNLSAELNKLVCSRTYRYITEQGTISTTDELKIKLSKTYKRLQKSVMKEEPLQETIKPEQEDGWTVVGPASSKKTGITETNLEFFNKIDNSVVEAIEAALLDPAVLLDGKENLKKGYDFYTSTKLKLSNLIGKKDSSLSYKIDGSCVVEYYESSVRIRVEHSKNKRLRVIYNSEKSSINISLIKSCINDFLSNKCLVSYYKDGDFREKYRSYKRRTTTGQIKLIGTLDVEHANNWRMSEKVGLSNRKEVQIFTNTADVKNPVINAEKIDSFSFDWPKRRIMIGKDNNLRDDLDYYSTVLKLNGSLFLRPIGENIAKDVINAFFLLGREAELIDILTLITVLENNSVSELTTTDHKGATIASMYGHCSTPNYTVLANGVESIKSMLSYNKFKGNLAGLELVEEYFYEEFIEGFVLDENVTKYSGEVVGASLFMPQSSGLAEMAETIQFSGLTNVDVVVGDITQTNLYEFDPSDQPVATLSFDTSAISVKKKITNVCKNYYSKWKNHENVFSPFLKRTFIGLSISKEISSTVLPHLLKKQQRYLDSLLVELEGFNKKLARLDNLSSVIIELETVLSLPMSPEGSDCDVWTKNQDRLTNDLALAVQALSEHVNPKRKLNGLSNIISLKDLILIPIRNTHTKGLVEIASGMGFADFALQFPHCCIQSGNDDLEDDDGDLGSWFDWYDDSDSEYD